MIPLDFPSHSHHTVASDFFDCRTHTNPWVTYWEIIPSSNLLTELLLRNYLHYMPKCGARQKTIIWWKTKVCFKLLRRYIDKTLSWSNNNHLLGTSEKIEYVWLQTSSYSLYTTLGFHPPEWSWTNTTFPELSWKSSYKHMSRAPRKIPLTKELRVCSLWMILSLYRD